MVARSEFFSVAPFLVSLRSVKSLIKKPITKNKRVRQQHTKTREQIELPASIGKRERKKTALCVRRHREKLSLSFFLLRSATMTTPARRRLMRDFKKLQADPPEGVSGAPCENNILL